MKNLQTIKQRYGIIGRSPLLDRALDMAVRVSGTDLSVLIFGESGVGKEVFSKIIHSLSARKHNDFIAINCGAIPEGTINSELFGHEKGAFTGATSDRKGYFEAYDGGTIFLDEVGELPLDTQAFLLRILEQGEFIRVGSSKVQRTDVRIIAATNVDLMERIKKGKFREDLYYRLNSVSIKVPPLRDRKEDVYLLFRKFAVDFAEKYRTTPIQLDEQGQQLLEKYSWPGNIRELKNFAEKLSVLSEERVITADHMARIVPAITDRHLPMIPDSKEEQSSMQEREILYKLLFDMKNDLNDLKKLVFELMRNNNLSVSNSQTLRALNTPGMEREIKRHEDYLSDYDEHDNHATEHEQQGAETGDDRNRTLILNDDESKDSHYNSVEIIDENLSLEYHEKNLIQKALRKYNNRRKEASQELGISERTLYRKIKQYNL